MNHLDKNIIHKNVDVIASGYEWTCPNCGELNKEYEYRPDYYCSCCGEHIETSLPEHCRG